MSRLPHPEPLSGHDYSAVELLPDDSGVLLLEQRLLPAEEVYLTFRSSDAVATAITDMVVRGAPAIGITAAYAMVLAAKQASGDFVADLERAAQRLAKSRPTAVNLFWALQRMLITVREISSQSPISRVERLAAEARAIHTEDVRNNRRMGQLGAARVPDGATVLTHCNAGALATGGYGTALGVIRAAHDQGKRIQVIADETRPYLQGSRLTAWELQRDGISVEVVCDSAAASLFGAGVIDLAVVGADRVAANGDVANKIGTYSVACVAAHHGRPLYVAAPWSTVDLACEAGARIPIEARGRSEIASLQLFAERGTRELLPEGVGVRNPAFDVTPASLIRAIFTERGVVEPVAAESLARLARGGA